MEVFIIGGGASGIVAAIFAARAGKRVTILEANDRFGKKLLLTGNGRCNYFNEDLSISHFHSQKKELLPQLIKEETLKEVLSFFEEIGIVPKIKNGYYYPYSNQATSIREALLVEAEKQGVRILTEEKVRDIRKKQTFEIYTETHQYQADIVVLATGSKAYPKTGSTGDGYTFAKSFGHSIVPILPSLVPLVGEERYFSLWNGIRSDVKLTLFENEKKIAEEFGEIQLTNYGISGICVFNLSGYVAKGLKDGKKERIEINFMPWVSSLKEAFSWMEDRSKKLKGRTIEQLFEGFLNYKLIFLFCKLAPISKDLLWENLSDTQKETLISMLFSFSFDVKDTKSYEQSQVCSGGVPLSEVKIPSLESKLVQGLYFTGELLDVDGDCGGYNLSFAWLSGLLAGKDIGRYDTNKTSKN